MRGEHGLLLAEVFYPNGQYRSLGRRLSAEPPQVCLAERPFPRERLARDEPGPVAVPLVLGGARELSGQLSYVVKVRHTGTVPGANVRAADRLPAARTFANDQFTNTFGEFVTLVSLTGPNVAEKFAEAGQSAPPLALVNFCLENLTVLPVFDACPLILLAL